MYGEVWCDLLGDLTCSFCSLASPCSSASCRLTKLPSRASILRKPSTSIHSPTSPPRVRHLCAYAPSSCTPRFLGTFPFDEIALVPSVCSSIQTPPYRDCCSDDASCEKIGNRCVRRPCRLRAGVFLLRRPPWCVCLRLPTTAPSLVRIT